MLDEAEARLLERTLARAEALCAAEAEEVARRIAGIEARLDERVVPPTDDAPHALEGRLAELEGRLEARMAPPAGDEATEARLGELEARLTELLEAPPAAAPAAPAVEGDAEARILKTVLERLHAAGAETSPIKQRVLALEQRLDEIVFRLSR
jgi:hypothetical protein